MSHKVETSAKAPTTASITPDSGQFQSRPFSALIQENAPETSALEPKGEAGDKNGHNFGNIRVNAESPPVIQPKLKLGPVGDKYEQEADRVASQVMNDAGAPIKQGGAVPTVQRQVGANAGGGNVAPNVEAIVEQQRGGGQPLADNDRQQMEQRIGGDFSTVRVHTDMQAHVLNEILQARAFTTGQDIFFGRGEYNPRGSSGQHLLAHELVHIQQQARQQPAGSNVAEVTTTTGTDNDHIRSSAPATLIQRQPYGRGYHPFHPPRYRYLGHPGHLMMQVHQQAQMMGIGGPRELQPSGYVYSSITHPWSEATPSPGGPDRTMPMLDHISRSISGRPYQQLINDAHHHDRMMQIKAHEDEEREARRKRSGRKDDDGKDDDGEDDDGKKDDDRKKKPDPPGPGPEDPVEPDVPGTPVPKPDEPGPPGPGPDRDPHATHKALIDAQLARDEHFERRQRSHANQLRGLAADVQYAAPNHRNPALRQGTLRYQYKRTAQFLHTDFNQEVQASNSHTSEQKKQLMKSYREEMNRIHKTVPGTPFFYAGPGPRSWYHRRQYWS